MGSLAIATRDIPPAANPAAALNSRECDILLLSSLGDCNKRIARRLQLSVRTIENHRADLRRKLGTGTLNRLEAMAAVVLRHDAERVALLLGVEETAVEHRRRALQQATG